MMKHEQRFEPRQQAQPDTRCVLCSPREPNNAYRLEVAPLSRSTLYLFSDQRFRGYCLLIFDPRHATALEQLSEEEYQGFMNDLRDVSRALRLVFQPDHMNYECLGNTTPHLHWHIIPRYRNDPRWGQPVWEGWPRDEFNVHRFTLAEQEYHTMIEAIRCALGQLFAANTHSISHEVR